MDKIVMARKVSLHEADRSFDIAFWQAQSTSARFEAAWELVEHYQKRKGKGDELRLQRTIVNLQRQRG